jgi:hypothetical protein
MQNPHAVSLAVIAGTGDRDRNAFDLAAAVFHGTAFCLARDLFITAAHVYRAAQGDGEVAVARLTRGQVQAQTVRDAEVFDDIDVALLMCPNLWAELLPVSFGPQTFLADVFCYGYPFGLEMPNWYLRAFRGHVVTRRSLPAPLGGAPGYELSFVPPPGLSGAPLLVSSAGGEAVTGMVLKHHRAELGDRSMDLGLALDIEELLTRDSRLVGGSIAEKLYGRPRLIRNVA